MLNRRQKSILVFTPIAYLSLLAAWRLPDIRRFASFRTDVSFRGGAGTSVMVGIGGKSEDVYPGEAAPGSEVASRPLVGETLLRLVPGDARRRLHPVRWRGGVPPIPAKYDTLLSVGRNGCNRSITVKLDQQGASRPAVWLDFVKNSLKNSEFELEVTIYAALPGTDLQEFTERVASPAAEKGSVLLLGRGALIPGDFEARSVGALTRALTDEAGRIVGDFSFEYVVTRPFAKLGTAANETMRWDEDCVPRFVGHRGLGSSKTASVVAENTVKSFRLATAGSRVKHVELDVQLSSDGVPVIFHDWAYKMPPYKMFVHNLTAKEFLSLEAPAPRLAQYPPEPELVTILTQVCRALPTDIGILVELKYPPPNVQARKAVPYPDHNSLVDATLESLMLEAAGANEGRPVAFLSFDADICTMLAMKQTMYPVFFLHCERRDGDECDDADPRTVNVNNGIKFARSQNLTGMVMFAEMVLEDESLAGRAVSSGLSLLTYGGQNRDPEIALRQLTELGVQGVIADDVLSLAEAVHSKLGPRKCDSSERSKLSTL